MAMSKYQRTVPHTNLPHANPSANERERPPSKLPTEKQKIMRFHLPSDPYGDDSEYRQSHDLKNN